MSRKIVFLYNNKRYSADEFSVLIDSMRNEEMKNCCIKCRNEYTKFAFRPYEMRKFVCSLCNTIDLCEECVFYCNKCKVLMCDGCREKNVCKKCTDTFCGKCYKSRCEECQSTDYCHNCLYANKFKCYDCIENELSRTQSKIVWNKIDDKTHLPKSVVLCTNNIEAGNNEMSHVWVCKLKRTKNGVEGILSRDYYGTGNILHVDYWAKLSDLELDHTGSQVMGLKLFGSEDKGYYSYKF